MLAIRMQRTGRRGHAMFRVIVQDSRYTPTSGKVVANLGHYDPHTKAVTVDKDKASLFLKNGAQPSERVARLLKKEGVKLPDWVVISDDIKKKTRNPEKLRKDQPKEEKVEEKPAVEVTDVSTETPEKTTVEAVDEAKEESTDTAAEEATEPEASKEAEETPTEK